jgi:ribonuclease HII
MHPETERQIKAGLQRMADSNARHIIGVDECGYGSWAGPVVVCAAVVLVGAVDPRIRDSKKVTSPRVREYLANLVLVPPLVVMERVEENSNEVIDRIGLVTARDALVVRATRACLRRYPSALVVMDGNVLPAGMDARRTVFFPKADNLVLAVSAASLIAKAYRDSLMQDMHRKYPHYGFNTNVGYGSRVHEEALREYGVCPIHRVSYRNIRQLVAGRE